jgi:Fibronectin type III domain
MRQRSTLLFMAALIAILFPVRGFGQLSEERTTIQLGLPKTGNDCQGGQGYGDGSYESGYKFNSFAVSTGSYVMAFDLPANTSAVTAVCVCWLRQASVLDPTTSIAFAVNVWDDNGPAGAPGTLLGQGVGNAQAVSFAPGFFRTEMNVPVSGGRVWIGPQWSPGSAGLFYLCSDENGPSVQPAFRSETTAAPNQNLLTVFPNYKALGIRVEFAQTAGPSAPTDLSATAISASQIGLAWQDNASNEDSFRIEQLVGGGFQEVGTVGANTTSVGITGLAPATSYSFRVRASNAAGNSEYTNTASAITQGAPPPPPTGAWLTTSQLSGFQFKVRINGTSLGSQVADCVPETLCVAGSIPTRAELFLRIIGPRPNGFLWAQVIRFTTSRLEVWVQRTSGGVIQYYDLPSVSQDSEVLSGLVDKEAFQP